MSELQKLLTSNVTKKVADLDNATLKELQTVLASLGYYTINIDGIYGNGTATAWSNFKKDQFMSGADLIGGGSLRKLLSLNLSGGKVSKYLSAQQFKQLAIKYKIPEAGLRAVVEIESRGSGFLPDGRPKILFERHIFHKYAPNAPSNISSRNPGGYIGGAAEHTRLAQATKYNRAGALMSASWGLGQVMGFNYQVCGYASVQEFVNDMYAAEYYQLMAMMNFIKNNGLIDEIQRQDWHGFARRYNGTAYMKNNYAQKLAWSYDKWQRQLRS